MDEAITFNDNKNCYLSGSDLSRCHKHTDNIEREFGRYRHNTTMSVCHLGKSQKQDK